MKQLPPDTPEQSLITQYKGPRLVVKAYAGTGKTTTLVKYAHNNIDSRILYLAYNRAIRDEAREKFPAKRPTSLPTPLSEEAIIINSLAT